MEDWEDEKVSALPARDQPIHKWDDEDVDENDITESWEDLDEPAPLKAIFFLLIIQNPCHSTYM
ncbi:eukaryotic translation initiation factor 3 subunit J-like [Pyrus ussuriensis x Pyrus communis]|uniref:Eukaryotic translation initiation factor 3 subunit J-like n=1 Tax=Pyrus ussuriensis x Pyrus communis TaxID=2448454 RepID=A0A5N5FR19_9ROSA|nr:eukaryotic translation initiation factor 3 subunit J-like [Pyrus ussuriensis x Pyrus communis]